MRVNILWGSGILSSFSSLSDVFAAICTSVSWSLNHAQTLHTEVTVLMDLPRSGQRSRTLQTFVCVKDPFCVRSCVWTTNWFLRHFLKLLRQFKRIVPLKGIGMKVFAALVESKTWACWGITAPYQDRFLHPSFAVTSLLITWALLFQRAALGGRACLGLHL